MSFWTSSPILKNHIAEMNKLDNIQMFLAALFTIYNSIGSGGSGHSWTSISNKKDIFCRDLQKWRVFPHYGHCVYIDYFIWRDVCSILLSEEGKIQDVIDNMLFLLVQDSSTFLVKQNLDFPFVSVMDWNSVQYPPAHTCTQFICWNYNA